MRAFGWLRRLWERYDQLTLEPGDTQRAIAPPPENSKDTAIAVQPVVEPPVVIKPVEPAVKVIELPPAEVVVDVAPVAEDATAKIETAIAREIEDPKIVDTTAEPSRRIAALHRRSESPAHERAHYFTPAQYAGMSTAGWLLAPDLAFQLRKEAPRQLPASASAPSPRIEPVPPVQSPRNEVIDFLMVGKPVAPPDVSTSRPGVLASVDPGHFTEFLIGPEGDPAFSMYLAEPLLLEMALALRARVLRNFAAAKQPFTAAALLAEAVSIAPHQGTALMICHNVTKAFARGGAAIEWTKTDRIRGEYSDGVTSYHAAGSMHPAARSVGSAVPSIFYLLLAAAEFGVVDPGDWYRYFGMAALGWYTGSGSLAVSATRQPPGNTTGWIGLARSMQNASPPAPASWAWANAVSFWEGAVFARSQKSCAAMGRVQLRGARAGIELAGRKAGPEWRWFVPKAGSVDESAPVELSPNVAETLGGAVQ